MRIIYVFIILIILNGCSFDKKSGIWKNEIKKSEEKNNLATKDFESFKSSQKTFYKIIPYDGRINLKVQEPVKNTDWIDVFYNYNNNFDNFYFKNSQNTALKSRKITNHEVNDLTLFENNNLIVSNSKGDIIIYSTKDNLIKNKFNFYKKRNKNLKKILNYAIEDEIVYVSDNLGYIYAYSYILDKVLWAKNYKIPFRSNIKLIENKIIAANQNNELYVLDKMTGNLIKLIPSEDTIVKKSFINNISLGPKSIYFLNTYGSLYSININNFKLNWLLNLNDQIEQTINNIFTGTEAISYKDKVLVSSNNNFFILDSISGSILSRKNFSLLTKPVVSNNFIFLITKNNLLISMNINNGNIIYSIDIDKKITKFTGLKKEKVSARSLMLVNNNIYIFLKNSHLIKFDLTGEIEEITRLPSNLKTNPFFVNSSLFYLDKRNKLLKIN
jgi:outer membrane protein assembly factor BamB